MFQRIKARILNEPVLVVAVLVLGVLNSVGVSTDEFVEHLTEAETVLENVFLLASALFVRSNVTPVRTDLAVEFDVEHVEAPVVKWDVRG